MRGGIEQSQRQRLEPAGAGDAGLVEDMQRPVRASSHKSPHIREKKVELTLKNKSVACVNFEAEVDAPHDVMFELLADPSQHAQIFDSIQSADSQLLEDNGDVKKWQLDYKARWKFWKVNGVCENRLWMWTDSRKRTVTFKLREPGFLTVYEGTWTIEGPNHPADSHQSLNRCSSHGDGLGSLLSSSFNAFALGGKRHFWGPLSTGDETVTSHPINTTDIVDTPKNIRHKHAPTTVRVHKTMRPKICPPYPLNMVLKNHALTQVQGMLSGLLIATRKALEEEAAADGGKK